MSAFKKLLTLGWVVGLVACAHHPVTAPESPSVEPVRTEAAVLPQDWTDRELPGKARTRYSMDERASRPCVQAKAQGSASLLRRRLQLPVDQLQEVRFEWWIDRFESSREVEDPDIDDAPASLVLAFDGDVGLLPLRTRMLYELAHTIMGEAPPYATLMYVWDAKAPVGTVKVSPRSDRIRKIVIGSGQDRRGGWMRFSRNVVDDYRLAFGEAAGPLIGAALMTDADNGRGRAEACYGPVQFLDAAYRELPGSLRF